MAESDELPTLEHGRYRLWKTDDGGWLLARAAFTCDRCQSCGCGEQQDHVIVPGMMVRMAEAMQNSGPKLSPLGMFRRLMGRGGTDGRDGTEGSGGSAETAESGDPAGGDLDYVLAAGSPDQEGSGSAGDGGPGDPGQV